MSVQPNYCKTVNRSVIEFITPANVYYYWKIRKILIWQSERFRVSVQPNYCKTVNKSVIEFITPANVYYYWKIRKILIWQSERFSNYFEILLPV